LEFDRARIFRVCLVSPAGCGTAELLRTSVAIKRNNKENEKSDMLKIGKQAGRGNSFIRIRFVSESFPPRRRRPLPLEIEDQG
jgi:hypothetical protein